MDFNENLKHLKNLKEELLKRKNLPFSKGNGIYEKFEYPIFDLRTCSS